ncbi:hypothetical protein Tco_0708550 [Tanacetum coccineum]
MIACVEKTAQNADFYQIIDFLTGCSINYSLLVDPDLIGPWLQQFWATASLKVINDVPHIRAKVAGKKILISEATIRADLLFDDENGVDCFPKQVIWDLLRDIGYEGLATNQKFNFSLMILTGMLGHISNGTPFLMYPRCSRHSNSVLLLSQRILQYKVTASFHGTAKPLDSDAVQGTVTLQVLLHIKVQLSIPKSHNDYAPTDGLKHLDGDEDFRYIGFEKKNKDEGTLSEEHIVQEEDTAHPFFDDIVDKDAAVTPDLERKKLDLETTQSTARQGTITPRTLNFEDEAGPSSPLRPIQVIVAISRPRGLSIPGPIQSQSPPQQPSQCYARRQGKGILVVRTQKEAINSSTNQSIGDYK